MHRILLLTALALVMTTMQAKTIYVATDGNDNAAGTIDAPMATLPAAYKKITNGDTICFRGGTYHVTDEQVMKTDNTYAYVFALEKAGTATRRTCIMGYPGERPVFDFSALQLDGAHRFLGILSRSQLPAPSPTHRRAATSSTVMQRNAPSKTTPLPLPRRPSWSLPTCSSPQTPPCSSLPAMPTATCPR